MSKQRQQDEATTEIGLSVETAESLIASLTVERDEFVAHANRRIGFLDGKIDVLREMVAQAKEEQTADAGTASTNGRVLVEAELEQ